MTFLPDVNVWLALALGDHIHHAKAKQWYESASGDDIALCRITQMGLLRLLTNPRIVEKNTPGVASAWKMLDDMRQGQDIAFAQEPRSLEQVWRDVTSRRPGGSNSWTDGYLLAFAEAAGYTLVTFDRALRGVGASVRLLA